MTKPARYYNAANNPNGEAFSGVPLGNIDEETWNGLPEHLQNSVDAHPMYRKTPLPRPKAEGEEESGSSDSGDTASEPKEEETEDVGAEEEKETAESEDSSEGGE